MNFNLIRKEKINEINSTAFVYTHKSGAKILHIKNEEENKVFSITFKTPVKDDTGVAHVVEHCVLCGSEKFPVKDPFNELIKSSLKTYLNASTFRDKTTYPVASCSEKDFFNLMTVYLDGVFKPLTIRGGKEVFLQEGINVRVDELGNKIGYGGIVYNEMQGVYSNPVEFMVNVIYKELFPDTQYAFDAGGVPKSIENLTYEQFLEFYKEKYIPSNCIIYLFGNLNIEKALEIIDSYLYDFEYKQNNIKIDIQEPFKEIKEMQVKYNTKKNNDEKFMSISYVTGELNDSKLIMAIKILQCYFFELQVSPLKESLLQQKICKEIINNFDFSILQPVFSIILKNANGSMDQFQKIVNDVFRNTTEKGFNGKILEACINKLEFIMKEENYGMRPKGLVYSISILSEWLNLNESFEKLKGIKYLDEIKNDKSYLIEVIEKYFLNNKHMVCISMYPELSKEEGVYTEKASKTELLENIKLSEYMNLKDSEDDIEKLPLIKIEEINSKREFIEPIEKEINCTKVLHTNIETNGILHLNFIFNTMTLPQKYIPYLGILRAMLGKLQTKKYCYEEFNTDINNYLGGFGVSFKTINNVNTKEYLPQFIIRGKGLKQNSNKIFELVREVLDTDFSNKEKMEEILNEVVSNKKTSFINNGHELGICITKSLLYDEYKYQDLVYGYKFYKFAKEMIINFNERFEELRNNLQYVVSNIFNKNNLILNICCSEKDYCSVFEELERFVISLNNANNNKVEIKFREDIFNTGILTQSKVQYVVCATKLNSSQFEYSSKFQVASFILNKDYLMKEVRIRGGAYGVGSTISINGLMYAYSYRDPHLQNTIDVFNNKEKFLAGFKCNEREMNKYIVGVMSKYCKEISIVEKNELALQNYFMGISQDYFFSIQEEILNTKIEDINKIGTKILKMNKIKVMCVTGNKFKIENIIKNSHLKSKLYEI